MNLKAEQLRALNKTMRPDTIKVEVEHGLHGSLRAVFFDSTGKGHPPRLSAYRIGPKGGVNKVKLIGGEK